MPKQKIRFNSDKILSLSAMAISFITLIIFIYQTNLMSRQNYTSIMPYLEIATSTSHENYSFELNLKNHGVGPAIIESVQMKYDGKNYDLVDFGNHLFKFISSISPDFDRIKSYSSSSLDKGMAIPANVSYNVIAIKDSVDFQIITSGLEDLLDNGLEYTIIYKSILDERWRIHNDLDGPEKLR